MDSHRPQNLFYRIRHNRSGSFAVSFAVASTLIFLAVGLAVDYAMSLGTKTQINNALDAATLATGRALSIGEIATTGSDAEDYFKAVFAANVGDDSFDATTYSLKNFTLNTSDQTVSAEMSVDQSLVFLRIGAGRLTQAVASYSATSYGIGSIEVAMVLDVTGSMGSGSGSKLDNLKDAATLGVTELLDANTATEEHIRISLVPYDYGVNVGNLAKYVYPDYLDAKSDAPVYDSAYSDAYSGAAAYDAISFLESYGANCWIKSSGKTKCNNIPSDFVVKSDGNAQDDCATDRKAPLSSGSTSYQYTDDNPSKGMISRDSRLAKNGCPNSELVTLTSNETTLKNAISGLSGGGFTAGHIGLQWAWYTLSHNWADYIDGTASDPGDMSTDDELEKFIILMTDGIFNTAYAGTNYSSVTSQSTLSKSHTDYLCTNIKTAGIKIFTIGYNTPGDADTMLESCASPDEGTFTYSYEPNSASELEQTYETIANMIRTLRLTQ